MIDLTLNKEQMKKNAKWCKKKDILMPTFKQMKNPKHTPEKIKAKLKTTGLWDVAPENLFRITWKNEPKKSGGLFSEVNYIELPSKLTGTKAKIVALVGKWFPTGAHKVGATYGCLAPALATGQFHPETQKAVWPSTGNYCRGGAYVSALLNCSSIAILPEEMSQERFNWLKKVAGEVIATPGCESNVKEIFDKCHELNAERGDNIVIFNQFDQMGNHLWHYEVTGSAMEEVIRKYSQDGYKYKGVVLTSGSAGTTGCADYLKEIFPYSKLAVSEAVQCPTLMSNGFGGHRIEGIGDKHIPWIHNTKNTDMVMAIDDEHTIRLLRLFNEEEGINYLKNMEIDESIVDNLNLLGISGIANMLSAIKFAKYYELTEQDVVITVLTDSEEMYTSRLKELEEERGKYNAGNAIKDFELLMNVTTDYVEELTYNTKKRIHNLKYYTWVEQQGKTVEELNAQWYDDNYWRNIHNQTAKIDEIIEEFNHLIEKA
jgi:cysteine synthase